MLKSQEGQNCIAIIRMSRQYQEANQDVAGGHAGGAGWQEGGAEGGQPNRHLLAYQQAAAQQVEKHFPLLKGSGGVCGTHHDRLQYNTWLKEELMKKDMQPLICPSLNR
jgi:hypothetical protein